MRNAEQPETLFQMMLCVFTRDTGMTQSEQYLFLYSVRQTGDLNGRILKQHGNVRKFRV